jgi:hypothetical protein
MLEPGAPYLHCLFRQSRQTVYLPACERITPHGAPVISILCPTRKRPKQFRRMVESARATALKHVEIVAYCDDDDHDGIAACAVLEVKYIVGPRIVLSDCWNQCYKLATGDILGLGNDDIIFRTTGWDRMVGNAFALISDKILLVHGSDGGRPLGGFAIHAFLHRRWVEALGYFIPPYFVSDFADCWINDLATALGRRLYLPYLTEHMHYVFGKAEKDETTLERLERHKQENPGKLYQELEPQRIADLEKLRLLLDS